jgi:hypothetical protein
MPKIRSKKMIEKTYVSHLCPECGRKIGLHTNSPFGHNPLNNIGIECSRSQNSLAIEKLTLWLDDAVRERNAYMESYADACKDRDRYYEKLVIALGALETIHVLPFNITDEGVKIFHVADDALDKVEKIK